MIRPQRMQPVCLVLGIWLAFSGGTIQAGTGGIIALPQPGTKARSGLKVELDTRWVDGNGYRPIRIRVSPLLGIPAKADRRVEVTVRARSWRSLPTAAVTTVIDLQQGKTMAEAVVAVPSFCNWGNFDVVTVEDGRRLSDLSSRYLQSGSQNYYEWSEAAPSILIIDRDAPPLLPGVNLRSASADGQLLPDIRALAGTIPMNRWNGSTNAGTFETTSTTNDVQTLRLLQDLPRLEILPPSSLPESWIAFSSIDVMIIDAGDLQLLVADFPQQWQAIRAWLSTGTTLCVYGVPHQLDAIQQLETQVGIPNSSRIDPTWQSPSADNYGKAAFANLGNTTYTTSEVALDVIADSQSASRGAKPDDESPFLIRSAEQGWLVAIESADPFPGHRNDWHWLFKTIDAPSLMWYQRHGASFQRENREYWDLLIPGVGNAPVNSFLLLISLFIVVIGPVNYFVLQRKRRLYLLLVTVPVGAALITGGLLTYALTTDGISTRSRVRSIAMLDQQTGRNVAWSRQTYYAGLAPSKGLVYPPDASVYPIEFRPSQSSANRRIIWDGTQWMADGYFPSRITVQYLAVESRESDVRLDFTITDQSNPSVVNRLRNDVAHLVACGPGDRVFVGADIPDGAQQTLSEVDRDEAATTWNLLLTEARPQPPEGFDPYQIENAGNFFTSVNFFYGADDSLSDPTFKSSVPERELRKILASEMAGLRPKTYLAIVRRGLGVSMGIDSDQRASFHLVIGRW